MMNLINVLLTRGTTYYCGDGTQGFDGVFPQVTHLIVMVIMIGVPILLVILGMFDLGKAVTAQKEDEIKKSQGLFVKRLVAAILVFFVFTVVKIVIGWAAGDESANVTDCLNCFINNKSCRDTSGEKTDPNQEGNTKQTEKDKEAPTV